MGRHHISLNPDRSIVIVAVSGARNGETYAEGLPDFLKFYLAQPARCVLFDAVNAHCAIESTDAIAMAEACGRQMPPSRVAIVGRDYSCAYSRLWRRALCLTGHDAMVFTSVAQAEVWLRTDVDADTLYVA
ncbi:hypothetical protein [Glycocaulis sp.]